MSTPQDRLEAVRRDIADAANAVGRKPDGIRLLAVSKAQPAAALRAMAALGVREFGENYAQEMAGKAKELADFGPRFVFIGTVQSNKIALIVEHAAEIQSVESERHARLIAKEVAKRGKAPYPVYLLVNAGDEATKSGTTLDGVEALAATIAEELPELAVQGLMAIPPPLDAPGLRPRDGGLRPPPLYARLREVASRVGRGKLSLGMSGDLREAIAAGSDCVRIGTALFGARPAKA